MDSFNAIKLQKSIPIGLDRKIERPHKPIDEVTIMIRQGQLKKDNERNQKTNNGKQSKQIKAKTQMHRRKLMQMRNVRSRTR